MSIIIGYLVPLLAVALTYLLGRLQSQESKKIKATKERYEKLYVPFVSMLYRGLVWRQEFSLFPVDAQGEFIDLLFHNIQYVDIKTQALLPDFFVNFLCFLDHKAGYKNYPNAAHELNITFNQIVSSILSESTKLSQVLKLPPIGKTAENYFFLKTEKI